MQRYRKKTEAAILFRKNRIDDATPPRTVKPRHAYCKYYDYLFERSAPDEKGRTHYLHKRLRSEYLRLYRNMDNLWIWYDHIELGIPNTNNGIEALFTDLKTKLRVHNGLLRKTGDNLSTNTF